VARERIRSSQIGSGQIKTDQFHRASNITDRGVCIVALS
jgi:hypothetical protein